MMKLKPCPFCGGEAKFLVKTYREHGVSRGYNFGIYCTGCNLTTPRINYGIDLRLSDYGEIEFINDERQEAVEAWNRRVTDGTERKVD